MSNKAMIIGTGNVGASIAYCLINQRTAVNELVLVDINQSDAEGEMLDLRDTLAVSPSFINIHTGTYSDASDCDIVIITAGAPQKPGETRLDLLAKNAKIFQPMITQIMASGFSGIFIIVSNPVDIMTYLTWHFSGLPPEQVIGSGTVLDSARLRYRIAERLSVHPKSVHAYQVGEHGDTEFALWSTANLGGQPISDLLSPTELSEIENYARNKAYDIIQKKGATYYGIGACITHIINCILGDERRVLPISSFDDYVDHFNGFPTVLGRQGVIRRLGIHLSEQEGIKFQTSNNTIRSAIEQALSSLNQS